MVTKMKIQFNGWQVVTLVGMVLTAIVILVALHQDLSALITTGLLVASALGVPIVQGFVNSERMGALKEQGNGTMAAKDQQISDLLKQLTAAHNQSVQLAAMIPPDPKVNMQLGEGTSDL
jgi:hypothetical protein